MTDRAARMQSIIEAAQTAMNEGRYFDAIDAFTKLGWQPTPDMLAGAQAEAQALAPDGYRVKAEWYGNRLRLISYKPRK